MKKEFIPEEMICCDCGKTCIRRGVAQRRCPECAEKAIQMHSKNQAKRQDGRCYNCGEELPRDKRRFCCDECEHEWEAERDKEEWNRYASTLPERECEVCGKRFKPYSVVVDEKGVHPAGAYYCSIACTDRAKALGVSPRKCKVCGKTFSPKTHSTTRVCSMKCAQQISCKRRGIK